jgi:hypothetical protein
LLKNDAPSVPAVNLISSQVAGIELNRGKSASFDQIGLARFSFSFLFYSLFAILLSVDMTPK